MFYRSDLHKAETMTRLQLCTIIGNRLLRIVALIFLIKRVDLEILLII